MIGRSMSVDELMDEILRDTMFFEESGGGVTFSGGEPLAQFDFLVAMLKACRERGVATAVDTSCYASREKMETLAPLADLFLCDLKHADSDAHLRLTGVPNEEILANFQLLAKLERSMLVRIPVIPMANDDEENLVAMARFLQTLGAGVLRVDLLEYQEASPGKQARLVTSAQQDWQVAASNFPASSPERLEEIAAIFREFGFEVLIGG
jgi:pyruvate formate lyase activating enzyme